MELAAVISKAEHYLSAGALIPVLGSVPAAIKVGMGLIQTISGLAVAIIFVIPACCSEKAREIFKQGLVHIVHGGGNILVGILEAIPIVGTVVAFVGLDMSGRYISKDAKINPGVDTPVGENGKTRQVRLTIDVCCGKFLAYRSLVEGHSTISLKRTKVWEWKHNYNYAEAIAAKINVNSIAPYWLAV